MSEYFGKYRGKVQNNLDPLQIGRLQVSCPAVLDMGFMSWAMPCVPYAGPRVGFFALPPIGANVWVEFEGGNPDYPIWTGSFWTSVDEMPLNPVLPQTKVFKTECVTLTLNDLIGAGGFTVEVAPPAVAVPMKLTATSTGIELALSSFPGSVKISAEGIAIKLGAASIKLSPVGVNINDGALEVI
jgi:hypothetical protein